MSIVSRMGAKAWLACCSVRKVSNLIELGNLFKPDPNLGQIMHHPASWQTPSSGRKDRAGGESFRQRCVMYSYGGQTLESLLFDIRHGQLLFIYYYCRQLQISFVWSHIASRART
jgi:hypothetical protein